MYGLQISLLIWFIISVHCTVLYTVHYTVTVHIVLYCTVYTVKYISPSWFKLLYSIKIYLLGLLMVSSSISTKPLILRASAILSKPNQKYFIFFFSIKCLTFSSISSGGVCKIFNFKVSVHNSQKLVGVYTFTLPNQCTRFSLPTSSWIRLISELTCWK